MRQQLLGVAAHLCVENGLHALTLDAVAKEAGVSKGGLLHHFPYKQALLNALGEACREEMDRHIDEQMAKDKIQQGRFSRAYLRAIADGKNRTDGETWSNLAVLLISDAGIRSSWNAWLAQRLAEHRETDDAMSLLIVRLASDGLWLSDISGSPSLSQAKRKKLIARLVEMTRGA